MFKIRIQSRCYLIKEKSKQDYKSDQTFDACFQYSLILWAMGKSSYGLKKMFKKNCD